MGDTETSPGLGQDLGMHRNPLGDAPSSWGAQEPPGECTKVLGCTEPSQEDAPRSWGAQEPPGGMHRDPRKIPGRIQRDLGVHRNPPGRSIEVSDCTEFIQGDAPRFWGAQNPQQGRCWHRAVTSPLACPKLCCGPAQPWDHQHNPFRRPGALPSSSSPTENTQDGFCKCRKTPAPLDARPHSGQRHGSTLPPHPLFGKRLLLLSRALLLLLIFGPLQTLFTFTLAHSTAASARSSDFPYCTSVLRAAPARQESQIIHIVLARKEAAFLFLSFSFSS